MSASALGSRAPNEMLTKHLIDLRERCIWALVALLGAATLYSLVANNSFAQSVVLQVLAFALVLFALERRLIPASIFLRRAILLAVIAAAALHAALAPLPITVAGLTVHRPDASAEVVAVLAKREKVDDPVPAWVSSSRDINRVRFLLRRPIRGEQKQLMFRFSRDNRHYHLAEIEYGTDYFRLPIPLVRIKEDDFLRVARYNDDNNRLEVVPSATGIIYELSSKIRSKPTMSIPASEALVRHETRSSRANLVRLLWFFTHLGIILALWHRQLIGKTWHALTWPVLCRNRGIE